jgi:hypothetical protein
MPLSAESKLVLVRIRIERAKKHLADLEADIAASRDKSKHIVIARGSVPVTGFFQGEPPVVKIPRLPVDIFSGAGEVIHDLRSALDHLAYQLAKVGTPSVEPSRKVAFPIAKSAHSYEFIKPDRVAGMRPDAVAFIDALQPYKGGCNGDTLWRINELDNINKHKTHLTVAHDYLLVADWMPGDYLVPASSTAPFEGVEGFDAGVQEDLQLEVEKVFSDPQRDALLPSLRHFVEYIDKLVGTFLPLLE